MREIFVLFYKKNAHIIIQKNNLEFRFGTEIVLVLTKYYLFAFLELHFTDCSLPRLNDYLVFKMLYQV